MQDQGRWLRQELGQSLTSFQELMLTTFGTVRDGIDSQVRGFGERLDAGIKAIDDRAAGIAVKLNEAPISMALTCRVEEPSTASIPDSCTAANGVSVADLVDGPAGSTP